MVFQIKSPGVFELVKHNSLVMTANGGCVSNHLKSKEPQDAQFD